MTVVIAFENILHQSFRFKRVWFGFFYFGSAIMPCEATKFFTFFACLSDISNSGIDRLQLQDFGASISTWTFSVELLDSLSFCLIWSKTSTLTLWYSSLNLVFLVSTCKNAAISSQFIWLLLLSFWWWMHRFLSCERVWKDNVGVFVATLSREV